MESKSPERKFLHDISTPVGTALFLADFLLDKMKSENPDASHTAEMAQILESLLVAKRLIEGRRAILVEEHQRGTSKIGA